MEERPGDQGARPAGEAAGGRRPKRPDGSHTWLRYSHLGLQFCLTFLLLVGAGVWADRRLGTGPWLTVVGAAAGMAAATYLLVRQVGR
jgi:F0F1-type ATP synthase assembly protein I